MTMEELIFLARYSLVSNRKFHKHFVSQVKCLEELSRKLTVDKFLFKVNKTAIITVCIEVTMSNLLTLNG